jgi:hypothetical protein
MFTNKKERDVTIELQRELLTKYVDEFMIYSHIKFFVIPFCC